MSDDRVDFASMLASRLCHDLLSPIGAFANGLEPVSYTHLTLPPSDLV